MPACCGQLMVAGLPYDVDEPNYGGFKQYIWGLGPDDDIYVGHTATLCLPKSYIDAHSDSVGRDGTKSAWDNLQTVLDEVPGVDVAFGIDGTT